MTFITFENQSSYVLDKIDKIIIYELSKNCRKSFTDIAISLGLAAGTIHVRVSKLIDAGIIKKHTLEIDFKAIGHEITAFFDISYDFKKGSESKFKEELKENYSNILEFHSISGRYDFRGKIVAPNLSFLLQMLDEIRAKEGVLVVEESICTESHFCDPNRLVEVIYKSAQGDKETKNEIKLKTISFTKELNSKTRELENLKSRKSTKSVTEKIKKLENEIKNLKRNNQI